MGFLSKLFGDAAGKAAKDMISGIINGQGSSTDAGTVTDSATVFDSEAATDCSYGKKMPKEANQYNYNGSYTDYFEEIFKQQLPTYTMEKQKSNYAKPGMVYTFYSGSTKALVVELISDKSSVYKLRNQCARESVPYLRFYYDHQGWWNTRSYVIDRIQRAIFG